MDYKELIDLINQAESEIRNGKISEGDKLYLEELANASEDLAKSIDESGMI